MEFISSSDLKGFGPGGGGGQGLSLKSRLLPQLCPAEGPTLNLFLPAPQVLTLPGSPS